MLTASLMLLAATAPHAGNSPAIPAFFTGERLYEICTGEERGQCWMYVAGALDGMFEAETSAGARSICAARSTNRGAAERVTEFLRANPDSRSKAAAAGVREALRSELRCGGDEMAKSRQ